MAVKFSQRLTTIETCIYFGPGSKTILLCAVACFPSFCWLLAADACMVVQNPNNVLVMTWDFFPSSFFIAMANFFIYFVVGSLSFQFVTIWTTAFDKWNSIETSCLLMWSKSTVKMKCMRCTQFIHLLNWYGMEWNKMKYMDHNWYGVFHFEYMHHIAYRIWDLMWQLARIKEAENSLCPLSVSATIQCWRIKCDCACKATSNNN